MPEDESISEEEPIKHDQSSEKVNENISQEQLIESIQASTNNPQLSIENMEVHHHPDLHYNKKNFKEYFLEFLMIFLAVTMGFFALSNNPFQKNGRTFNRLSNAGGFRLLYVKAAKQLDYFKNEYHLE